MASDVTQAVAIFNSDKKHSKRYDIYVNIDGDKVQVGAFYWPKNLGVLPQKVTVLQALDNKP